MTDLEKRVKNTLKTLQSFQENTGISVQEWVDSLKSYCDDSSSQPYECCTRIALAGSFSCGKSSFINSLLGKEGLAPVASRPSTRVITRFVYGDSLKCVNSEGKEISLEEYQNAATCIRDVTAKDNVFTIQYPADFLRNIVLSDVPGFDSGDAHQADSAVSRIENEKADVIIFLVNINDGTIKENAFKELLGDSVEKKGILNAGENRKKLYVVITRADDKPPSAREGVVKSVEKALLQHEVDAAKVCLYATMYKNEKDRQLFEKVKQELCSEILHNASYSSEVKKNRIDSCLKKKQEWAEGSLTKVVQSLELGKNTMVRKFYESKHIPDYIINSNISEYKKKFDEEWSRFQKFVNEQIDNLNFCEVRRYPGTLFDDYAVCETNWKLEWNYRISRIKEFVDENVESNLRFLFRLPQSFQDFSVDVKKMSRDYDVFGNSARNARYAFRDKQNERFRSDLKNKVDLPSLKNCADWDFDKKIFVKFKEKKQLKEEFDSLFNEILTVAKG